MLINGLVLKRHPVGNLYYLNLTLYIGWSILMSKPYFHFWTLFIDLKKLKGLISWYDILQFIIFDVISTFLQWIGIYLCVPEHSANQPFLWESVGLSLGLVNLEPFTNRLLSRVSWLYRHLASLKHSVVLPL